MNNEQQRHDPGSIVEAPAWTADWLVAWLAAVGVTYRDRTVRLRWTDGPLPTAVFHCDGEAALNATVPSFDEIKTIVIARDLPGFDEFPRKPTHEQFSDRARPARERNDLSLGATVSSFGIDKTEELPHSPFDPSVPRGITLHQRLLSSREAVADGEFLVDSMRGQATTASTNGLGFDFRRLAASSVPGDNLVIDPLVETMAFFGLLLFTQYGKGTRGWRDGSAFSTGAFRWPVWRPALDWAGIDALFDRFSNGLSAPVTATFESVAYAPTATADTTRGFGSRRAETI